MDQFRRVYDDRPLPLYSQGFRYEEACATYVQTYRYQKIFVIASRSIATKTNAVSRLKAVLKDSIVGDFVGISSHTPFSECVTLIDRVRKAGEVDCLITLGGGSITDAGKLVRFALANHAFTKEELDTLWGGKTHANPLKRSDIKPPTIPLIHIPTTLSGGEFQHLAAATDTETQAKHLFEPGIDPTLVIQDPNVCIGTPPSLWLSSGIRALDHCIETLCSLQSNEKGDTAAQKGLLQLIPGLLKSKSDPTDLDAINLCHKGVISAMAAVSSGVPLGASHAIGHQLGPLGVGHGETSCILLPAVCKYNAKENANTERQSLCRDLLLEDKTISELLASRSHSNPDLGDILSAVVGALGLPRSLKEVNVGKDQFSSLARNSLDDIWIRTNAVEITRESQVMEILEMAA